MRRARHGANARPMRTPAKVGTAERGEIELRRWKNTQWDEKDDLKNTTSPTSNRMTSRKMSLEQPHAPWSASLTATRTAVRCLPRSAAPSGGTSAQTSTLPSGPSPAADEDSGDRELVGGRVVV